MHTLQLDFLGPFRTRKEGAKRYVLTCVEQYSRFAWLFDVSDKRPTSMLDHIFDHIFMVFGIPNNLITDRGMDFTSKDTEGILKQLGINHTQTSPYHAQSNGVAERTHQEVLQMMRKVCEHSLDWQQHLPAIQLALNSSVQSSHGQTPAQVFFGWIPKTAIMHQIPQHYDDSPRGLKLEQSEQYKETFQKIYQTQHKRLNAQ